MEYSGLREPCKNCELLFKLNTCACRYQRYNYIKMAYSCETERSSAYSNNLRRRMVWQREVLIYRYPAIAQNLNVDASTVWRKVNHFKDSGTVDNQHARKKSKSPQKLTPVLKFYILHTILSNPGIFLRGIKQSFLPTQELKYSFQLSPGKEF